LIVIGLLAITIALSYTMIRSQATMVHIQGTISRVGDARQAAYTGMMIAIRRMHEADWEGVEKTVTGNLDDLTSYEVTLQTGDAALLPTAPGYAEYPFRVTLVSHGRAVNPGNPDVVQTHTIKAVMQLVRRKLSDPPEQWSALQQYTVYQWSGRDSHVQVPVRTEGPVRLQGSLNLSEQYPSYDAARIRYLTDLEQMRAAGRGDYRPFLGPVYLPYSQNSLETLQLMQTGLNVQTIDVPRDSSSVLSHSGAVYGYQLFPGGQQYEVPSLQSMYGQGIVNMTIGPDPVTNPLAIFRSQGPIVFYDDVTFQGTIVTHGSQPDISISGENVKIEAINLPPLEDQVGDLQLPVAIVNDDLRLQQDAKAQLTGFVTVVDDFEVEAGSNDAALNFRGRLITGELKLSGRSAWEKSKVQWQDLYDRFMADLDAGGDAEPYFPRWLEEHENMQANPLLTIKPDSGSVSYHWHDWNKPIYQPHPDDEGLQWNLVRWEDTVDGD
jgi:hypothetical protein